MKKTELEKVKRQYWRAERTIQRQRCEINILYDKIERLEKEVLKQREDEDHEARKLHYTS